MIIIDITIHLTNFYVVTKNFVKNSEKKIYVVIFS